MKVAPIVALIALLAFHPVAPFSLSYAKAHAATDQAELIDPQRPQAKLSDRISLATAGRGNPWINMEDGHDLQSRYDDAPFSSFTSGSAPQPLALASEDFDEDGAPDLVSGFGLDRGGLVAVYRGNIDSIYPNRANAGQSNANGGHAQAPFFSPARVFPVPEPPDFVASGDFDGDNHQDVVTAARRSNVLYLLSGDGRGNLESARRVPLSGRVTAMACGDINRRDGLKDLVVAIAGQQGSEALVFESSVGALRAEPELIALPAEASALAIGQLDDDYPVDMVIAAGSELMIVQGHDRKLSLDETRRAQVAPPMVERIALPSKVSAIAIGDFAGNYHAEIAILSTGGKAELVRRKGKKWGLGLLANDTFEASSQFACGRISSLPYDNLVIVDEAHKQLHLLIDSQPSETLNVQMVPVTFDVEDAPIAVLPMRLNGDALSDLVVLKKSTNPIAVALTAPISTFVVTNTNDSGPGSLRQAIKDANNHAGSDMIQFNISGSGVHTITPLNALLINDPVVIDGYSQPGTSPNTLANGDNAVILVELNGANMPGGVSGLHLQTNAGGSTIKGLVINRFPDNGIFLAVSGNIIEGNFIGTNAAGTVDLGNANRGVDIAPGSNNTIGGTAPAARNLISGNDDYGLQIFGASSTGNKVQGNFIGTSANGSAAIGNTHGGIVIQIAPNNTIGGTVAAARNVISGNHADGVEFLSGGSSGDLVQGNLIGTDVSGIAPLGNTGAGLLIGNAPNALVGGTVAGARNIISGNGQDGVIITGSGIGAQVQGNFIGTDINGTAQLGNTGSGVNLDGTSGNIIGGAVVGARNIISGNNSHGVFFSDANPGSNQVQGNFIGADASGASALGNSGNGILVSFTHDVVVGGVSAGTANVIAYNGARGLYVIGAGSVRIAINGNSIHSNAALGIDLDPVGVAVNDPGDGDTGANNLQNFPVLSSASTSSVQGTLNSTASTTFRIEFFVNSTCDSSGNGEGQAFVGTTSVTTNGSGDASISFAFPAPVAPGFVITATATDPTGNTSEFSQCRPVTSSSGGSDTIGVYLPSNRTFYLRNSNTAGFADLTIQYGPPGGAPVVGDWDGNGTATIGVYDPSSRTFYLRNSNTPGFADLTIQYGPPAAIPLAGDWDGNGTCTIGVYDPSSRTFYLRNSNTAGQADLTIQYGPAGAIPVVGDWDGNGTTTIGVYDPSTQTFYLRNSNTPGLADLTIQYGPSGATPVVGDWDANGTVTIGVYDPANQTFYLRNSNSIGFADLTIRYGPSGATPLAGDWNGL